MLLVTDGSADMVFHDQAKHIPTEEPEEWARAIELVEVESVDSSSEGTELEDSNTKMVVRRKMMAE